MTLAHEATTCGGVVQTLDVIEWLWQVCNDATDDLDVLAGL